MFCIIYFTGRTRFPGSAKPVAEDSALRDTGTGAEHVLGFAYGCATTACRQGKMSRPGPGTSLPWGFASGCPCQAPCWSQHAHSLPPAGPDPHVGISVKPTSSFILYNMTHPPYTAINFVHNLDHLLTYYIKGCAIFCTHTPIYTHSYTATHYSVRCTRGSHLKYLKQVKQHMYVGGAQNLFGEKNEWCSFS